MSTTYERKRGIQIHRDIVYGSHARLLSPQEVALAPAQHSHRWTVFLASAATPPPKMKRKGKGKGKASDSQIEDEDINYMPGGADDLSWLIKRVTFKLHDTYAQPIRNVDKPPYQVSETGWGEFTINIRVTFHAETGEKPINFTHEIKLHHWGPHLEIQPDPSQSLLAAPDDPTPGGTVAATPGSALDESQTEATREQSEAVPTTAEDVAADEEKAADEEMNGGHEEVAPVEPAAPEVETGPSEVKDVEMAAPEGDDDEDAEGEEEEDADGEPDEDMPMEGVEDESGHADADVVKLEPTEDARQPVADVPLEEQPVSHNINPLPVHSWQFDELVFVDPTQQFYDLLVAHPPTPLPNRSLRKPQVEGDGAIAGFDRGSAGVPLEFDKEMVMAEAAMLDEARRAVVLETDSWRQKLIELEKEQQSLKEELGMA